MKRVLFVQYTNPAGYPPLQRSAALLARAGFEVLFAGIESFGTERMQMPDNLAVEILGGPSGGAFGPAKYAAYLAKLAVLSRKFRPAWCYASELLSTPAVLLLRNTTNARILYHEHDAPANSGSSFVRAAMRARARAAAIAEIVVIPAEQRRSLLPRAAADKAKVVWNCPLREEVGQPPSPHEQELKLVYAGSLSPDLLPLTFLDALALLPKTVSLDVYGYYTAGQEHYEERWRARMQQSDVVERVRMNGVVSHNTLLQRLSVCDVGIATILNTSGNVNLNAMAGASNKAFNYMARGLPFLVSDSAEWRNMFVENGFAVACDPASPESIVAAVNGLLDPAARRLAGQSAQTRIRTAWNYETQFAPVLQAMSA